MQDSIQSVWPKKGLQKFSSGIPILSALVWPDLPRFVPHGYCYLWNPWIVWLHVISDGLIALSYLCIPLALIYFVRRRSDLPFHWMFWMFGLFILGCGATHLMEAWTVWKPEYLVSGLLKAFTAAISVATAVMLIPLVPRALALPSPADLTQLNQQLTAEIVERRQAEEALQMSLEQTQRAMHESEGQKNRLAEQHYIEQVLHESQKRLQGIIDSAMDAIITVDEEHRIVLFNTAAEDMFRCPAREAMGTLIHRFVPSRFRMAHADHMHNFGATGTTKRTMGALEPLCGVRANGQEFPIEASISQIVSEGKKLFTVIIRDITERRMIEERLRDQAQLLELAQVMVRAMDGQILLWSKGAEKMYGYTKQEALGQISHDLLGTQFPQPVAEVEETLERKGIWEGELIHRAKDGSTLNVAVTKVLDRSEPPKILETLTDVTARRRAEQNLHDTETTFDAIIRSAMDAIITVDSNQRIVLFNAAAEKMFGVSYPDALGRPLEQFMPEAFRSAHRQHIKSFDATGISRRRMSTWSPVSGLRADNREFPLEASISQVEISGSKFFTAILRDISERQQHEEEIRRLNTELERRVEERTAQLQMVNQELEAFTYSVSHDLRAPIRHIHGFTRLLVEETAASLSLEAQHYLHRIQEGSQRMGILVDELLNLARVGRQSLSTEKTNMNVMVQEVIAMLAPEYENRNVEWKVSHLSEADCDATLVRQVFQNLIANALKYSRPRQPAIIEIGQTDRNGTTAFFVRDNGVGFSMRYADKLFGVFQRLHRAEDFEGSGVGLATVQRIVQKHRGKVWADAEPNRGATFFFTLMEEAEAPVSISTAGASL